MRNFTDWFKFSQKYGLENSFKLYYSTYQAIVMDNKDPEEKGRIKVKVPQITGSQVIQQWVTPQAAYAGVNVGFVAVPDIGAGVWVSFKLGNPRFPVYSGGWWAKPREGEPEMPEEARGEDYPNVKVFKTTSGHIMIFNDAKETLEVKDASGNSILMQEGSIKVENPSGGTVEIEDNLVKLYGEDQPAVLGDNNEALHQDVITELQDLITQLNNLIALTAATFTAQGTAFPPLAPAATAFANGIIPITTQLGVINGQLTTLSTVSAPATKSQRVKLS